MTTIDEEPYLAHYGILRRSGRYPWGSGSNPAQRSKRFLDHVAELRAQGLSDPEIAKGFGMTTTELRAANSIARNEKKQADIAQAQKLKDKGWSNVAIGEKMGINESSVRALLAPGAKDKTDRLQTIASMLQRQVDEKGYIDVGTGVEQHVGVSRTRLDTALAMLKEQGYEVHKVQTDQLGTGAGNKTTIKVLAPPGTTYKDIVTNMDKIHMTSEYSTDGGISLTKIEPPLSISSKRVGVNYFEDGGAAADGVIYVRPGVPDVSLGKSRYAQVRIAVDGSHYLKGMAMYKDDLPSGVDLVFNTNKKREGTTSKLDVMKKMERDKDGNIDPENPFGSFINRQLTKDLPDGTKKVTSVMNIVNEEGSWEKWSKNLSSQMLSKQSPRLAEQQLDIAYKSRAAELDTILSLTNPAVRKKLLDSFADGADSAAVHLKAAHLPRQASHVILPVNSLKETEIYAPNYRNGERVVLIRHPHGGIFEIPELTVNNRHAEAKKLLGDTPDAVGIHSKVAERLSGADFDGDTVLVIPNTNRVVKNKPPLEGLKDFDPKSAYPPYEGMKPMSSKTKGHQMGDVSNLITDMTIKGASDDELARAVRHSMVVIDAEKHNLDWKRSAVDNGIPQLKEKYQGRKNAGAATLISRASARADVPRKTPRPAKRGGPIDPNTGEKVFEPTGETYVKRTVNKRTGAVTEKTIVKTQRSQKMAETKDAFTLVSDNGGTPIEHKYAEYANKVKALANEARKASVNTKPIPYSKSAKEHYSDEVESLNAKLNLAFRNRPLERQAQLIANATVKMKRQANPDMDDDEVKKLKGRELTAARIRTGAEKQRVHITDNEWKAIQAGAITHSKLEDILANADLDRVKELAMPKAQTLMTTAKQQQAKALLAAGHTQAEVADHLGVSLTTLKRGLADE